MSKIYKLLGIGCSVLVAAIAGCFCGAGLYLFTQNMSFLGYFSAILLISLSLLLLYASYDLFTFISRIDTDEETEEGLDEGPKAIEDRSNLD